MASGLGCPAAKQDQSRHRGPKHTSLQARQQPRNLPAVGRDEVAMGLGWPEDEALQSQAAQVQVICAPVYSLMVTPIRPATKTRKSRLSPAVRYSRSGKTGPGIPLPMPPVRPAVPDARHALDFMPDGLLERL